MPSPPSPGAVISGNGRTRLAKSARKTSQAVHTNVHLERLACLLTSPPLPSALIVRLASTVTMKVSAQPQIALPERTCPHSERARPAAAFPVPLEPTDRTQDEQTAQRAKLAS